MGPGILRATSALGVARILQQVLALAQFLAVMFVFGSGREADILNFSLMIPMFIVQVSRGCFSQAFIPLFSEIREQQGPEDAWRFVSTLFIWATMGSVLMGTGIAIFAPVVISWVNQGFSPEDVDRSANLLRYMAIYLAINSLLGVPQSIYLSYKAFRIPALLSPVLSMIVVLCTVGFHRSLGLHAVVLGYVLGGIVELILQFSLLNVGEQRFKFSFSFSHPAAGRMRNLLGPRLLAIGLGKMNTLVDKSFASSLPAGSIFALNSGDRMRSIPLEIINASFGTVTFSHLSADAAKLDVEQLKQKTTDYVKAVMFVVLPMCAVIVTLARPTMNSAIQFGALNKAGIDLIADALECYALGMMAVAISTTIRGTFFAMQDTVTPLWTNIVGFVLNIAFNIILIGPFGMRGIAISTVLAEWIRMMILFGSLQWKLGRFAWGPLIFTLGKAALAAVGAGGFAWGVLQTPWGVQLTTTQPTLTGKVLTVAQLGMLAVIMVGLYVVGCAVLRVDGPLRLIKRVRASRRQGKSRGPESTTAESTKIPPEEMISDL